MLANQITELKTILKNKDIQKYAGDAFWDLIQAVVAADAFAGVEATKNIKELIFHMPTVIFWDKMKKFLLGTYKNYGDQVKMAAKFEMDEPSYDAFVKRQIYLINELNDDMKVDYFSSLTRCFLLTSLSQELYFKLAKLISACTPFELEYIQEKNIDFSSKNTPMISLLYQNGLFDQSEKEDGSVEYVFSDLAKALKQNSLNFDDGLNGQLRLLTIDGMNPRNIPEPTNWQEIEEILSDEGLTIDGGVSGGNQ